MSRSFRYVVASLFHCLVITYSKLFTFTFTFTYRLETFRCHVHKSRDARLILRGMPNWKCWRRRRYHRLDIRLKQGIVRYLYSIAKLQWCQRCV